MSGIAERLAEVLHRSIWDMAHGEHWPILGDDWPAAEVLAQALLPVVEREIAAARGEAEIAGQMKHITAEVARGDVPLSDTEEMIADLRARLSHVEAERDEAIRDGLRDRAKGVARSIMNAERDGYRRGRAETVARMLSLCVEAEQNGSVIFGGDRIPRPISPSTIRAALSPDPDRGEGEA